MTVPATCRCIPQGLDGGEDRCAKCGKLLTVDKAEAGRNQKLAQHAMRSRQKLDDRLRQDFERESRQPSLF